MAEHSVPATCGYTWPWNSKRLTGTHLSRIADLPASGSIADTRLVIEGRLEELGQNSMNTQVRILDDKLDLVGADGPFLEVPFEEKPNLLIGELDYAQDYMESGGRSGIVALREELSEANDRIRELTNQVESLQAELGAGKARILELWKLNCSQLNVFDDALTTKDAEIERLQTLVADLPCGDTTGNVACLATPSPGLTLHAATGGASDAAAGFSFMPGGRVLRRGKAPPVSSFTGEDVECQMDEWLPSLERASVWNNWTEEEKLLQLAGHLQGRALQEWNLLKPQDKTTFQQAVDSLRSRIDPANKAAAAQDFRHTTQREVEAVADFVRRLERVFRVAYGRDGMSNETRDMLLYCQVLEGLRYDLMKAPSVSGASNYSALCIAAKNEEKRLADLRKRQQYRGGQRNATPKQNVDRGSSAGSSVGNGYETTPKNNQRRCFYCKKLGHQIDDCIARKKAESRKTEYRKLESTGGKRQSAARQVKSKPTPEVDNLLKELPIDLLYSSESESDCDEVREVRVLDEGSRSQFAHVLVQGVPAEGIVDTGADITIIGRDLFARVAAAARLRKRDFRKADKVPRTYDRKTFHLDGCMDLDISFLDRTMKTTIYVKMDAGDQLLLSEGVCRQLGILSYHPQISSKKASKKGDIVAIVPMVRVSLVQSLRLPSEQSSLVHVKLEGAQDSEEPLIVEQGEELAGLQVESAVVSCSLDGYAHVLVTNQSDATLKVSKGTLVARAEAVDEIVSPESFTDEEYVNVRRVTSTSEELRKQKVREMVDLTEVPLNEKSMLHDFLADHHRAFSLEEGERGQTDLVHLEIDTGDASPQYQPPRRMPFAVRREVARQLELMQQNGVIQPSSSPWSSPVVIVRKKDGTHRFCVDYRKLNAVTKADKFPLPRIDDLLDQLCGARYFSCLDLASGFWQIPVHPSSQEKTAFSTPQGLFEFLVMPFGLKNAPSVFQRLMHSVIADLNPRDGRQFVAVYVDDMVVWSPTLTEHLSHLKEVIGRCLERNLKFKLSKCRFMLKEVEYLGHLITADGLKANHKITTAVLEFPRPDDLKELRRFLGLTSYYRRFISNFATIAQPLYHLTAKEVPFIWSLECEEAFASLKTRLATPPVLAYPSFDRDFTLETDASIKGLGAVLSQIQDDNKLHPVAYASRCLSHCERNYSVTELETLAVVWAISHFHAYLYGHKVTVRTDHTAVKAILETSTPTGKHARWWTRVYGRGIEEIHIVHRPGRENSNADALSRSPLEPAPRQGIAEGETQVAVTRSDTPVPEQSNTYALEQIKDPKLKEIIDYLEKKCLPDDQVRAKKLVIQESLFTLISDVLYYIDPRRDSRRRVAVPQHLREKLLEETHRGAYGGHFSGERIYKALVLHWWWDGMYADAIAFCKRCPECAIVTGGGRQCRPLLQPIAVERPFQIVAVDIMDLPCTERGNKHVIVFQDLFTKWPLVFPAPDQKAERLARLLCEEVVPLFGVPESLLSDRGANLLSSLMLDVCQMLGTTKLNTTAYHPECDGTVERFNRTLKAMLRKQAARFGCQWDKHLPGVLWAYRNTPHESTGEKPSFLLFGMDLRSPTEAALLPLHNNRSTTVSDYREELMCTLSTARQAAVESIRRAQKRYKVQYDRKVTVREYRVGDWILIRFPSEESGRNRKLSKPWHGPYRILYCNETNMTAVKVYFPEEKRIQVHQNRVKPCPDCFPAGYYWYGSKRVGPGRPPKWVDHVLTDTSVTTPAEHTPMPQSPATTLSKSSRPATRTRSSGKYSLRANPRPHINYIAQGRAPLV